MRLSFIAAATVLACAPGPRVVVPPPAEAPPDAGLSEADVVRAQLETLVASLAETRAAAATATWSAWLDAGVVTAPLAEASTGPGALALLRRAEALGVTSRRALHHLRLHVTGAMLARALAEEDAACRSLAATTMVVCDDRELRFRTLWQALASEPSALKRKKLWAAGLEAVGPLSAGLAHRDAVAREAAAKLELPSMLEFETDARELDLEALVRAAERLLIDTDDVWRRDLQTLANLNAQLPVEALTRADLPRVLRAPPGVDAALPAHQLMGRVMGLLVPLGLDPGQLTIDGLDAPQKMPNPLSVAVTSRDVRLSLRPAPGLAALTAALDELGAALALRGASTQPFEFSLLGDPTRPMVTGALFAAAPCALAGLPPAVRQHARAMRLFQLRRAAGVVLATVAALDVPPADAPARAVALLARALGVQPKPEDGARWRIDLDDFARAASTVRAQLAAAALDASLGEGWCTQRAAGEALEKRWAQGSSVSLDAAFGTPAESVSPLVLALRADGVDAGVVRPFQQPLQLDLDGGTRPPPSSPRPRLTLPDGGLPASKRAPL